MDPIELARQHARRLHDEAVQRGRNPWSPYEFAIGIASDLGITVETCAPDAALLDGGRAYFDPDLPLIVHETEGSPFDQAFLVAHEIGHAELGDGEEGPEPATYIDPARTSEAAPVAMDRVVDYSRRQRREVQMDLFARELLLPRPVAFDLHVAQGQTCSNIAARLGAPFEVVAQQMLDALLLPAFPVVAAADPVEIPLNDKQRAAAAHRGAAFLLQAGPGTGKTRTLVARVESLLDEGVDPRRIRPSKCPPPIGMVTGGQGSQDEIARAAHNEEQECLFYVAMSRARDRLAFYGATAKSNGTSRPLSRFLDRIGAVSRRPVTPLTVLPPAQDVAHIPVVFTGTPRFSSEAVGLYESCGRRFLYTHLLQVGGRRSMSAFMLMHEAIREVYRKVVAQGAVSTGQCEALLAEAFVSHGLHDHGYVEDYRAMASTMLGYFLESRAGALAEAPTALRITFNNHEVEVTPDEVLVRNGVRTLRRVKTGHASSQEGKDVGAAAFVLAARAAFPNAVVELVYLADAEAKPLVLSAKELSNRQVKLGNILRDIRGGNFRAEASDMTCPNCPAFFVCGAVPPGTLVKAF